MAVGPWQASNNVDFFFNESPQNYERSSILSVVDTTFQINFLIFLQFKTINFPSNSARSIHFNLLFTLSSFFSTCCYFYDTEIVSS